MGQLIDLSNRLTNDAATIKIDANHVYTVNRSKNAALLMMQARKDSSLSDVEVVDKIIAIGLGKEALDYINSLKLTIKQNALIVEAIMAAINEMPLEEVEKEAEKAAQRAVKSFQK